MPRFGSESVPVEQEQEIKTTDVSSDDQTYSGAERRRGRRLPLIVPIELGWKAPDGGTAVAQAFTRNVNAYGALLQMKNIPHQKICGEPTRCRCGELTGKTVPRPNTEIGLRNTLFGQTAQGRVVRTWRSGNERLEGIGIEVLTPAETFWGLTFQLQSTTLQLLEIERTFQTLVHEVDFRVLQNLHDAVDYLRGAASAVQQWQELHAQGKNAYSVLEVLSGGRVDLAIDFLRELAADIDASELTANTKDFVQLAAAVERLYDRMTRGPAMGASTCNAAVFSKTENQD